MTPATSSFAPLGRLLRRLGPQRWPIVAILVALVIDAAFIASIPVAVQVLIDRGIQQRDPSVIVAVLASLATAVLVVAAAGIYRDYLVARVSATVVNDLRREMFEQTQRLSMAFYSRTPLGDLLSRFSTDVGVIEATLLGVRSYIVSPFLEMSFAAALLFRIDVRLALVAMLVLPLSFIGPVFIAPRAAAESRSQREEEATVLSVLAEDLAAHAVVRAFGIERARAAGLLARLAQLTRRASRVGFFAALIDRSAGISISIVQIAVLAVGSMFALSGSLTVGELVSFQALFLTFSWSVGYILQYAPTIVRASASLLRVDELLREKPEVIDVPDAVELATLRADIVFDDVGFQYTAERREVEQVSFAIRAGQSVAFVGASGSGKSTVLNLLARFYEPASGRIAIDGRDLRSATAASWRRQLGIVFQESFLFNTTVLDNLRIGKPDASEDEIVAAARAAEVHEAIAAMPRGYSTLVGEGGRQLSGGQRQRIAIARALLRNPAVLLLDEATSALDAATEAAINATLEKVSRGRTMVSVTHRLASVAGFDRVCVFDRGRLVEQGNPSELLEARGAYARLWSKQSGFAIAEDGTAEVDVDRLKAIPLLSELPAELLPEVSDRLSTELFEPGDTIIEEDDLGDRFYLLARGSVRVTTMDAAGAERELAVLQDGDYFGEIQLLRDIRRTATVRARTPCVTLVLRRDQFQQLLARVPEVYGRLEQQIDERIGELVRAKVLL